MAQKDLYTAELVFTLSGHVQEDISVSPTITTSTLPDECFISQKIYGDYNAYTALYAEGEVLTSFANAYAKFDVEDEILSEVLADFLNLNNGRFIVSLSDTLAKECSLTVPNTDKPDTSCILMDRTYIIPVNFSFGTVNFVLSECSNE